MKRIAIVGASASGIYLALDLLTKHQDFEVTLFDHEEKLGKKIAATGNGRCNILHDNPLPENYDHPEIFKSFLQRIPFSSLKEKLIEWGIPLKREGDLYYPLSESAPSLVRYLWHNLTALGAKLRLGEKALDYSTHPNGVALLTSEGEEAFDYLVFAVGGKSGKNLGSDGSLFSVFERHGYQIQSMVPVLCPIRTKEHFPSLQGLRVNGTVRIKGRDTPFEKSGQILFKKDGLSGIVIFDASIYLAQKGYKGIEIVLDLFPHETFQSLKEKLRKDSIHPHFLEAYFPLELARHFENIVTKQGVDGLVSTLKHWAFHYEENYPFSDAQVTMGGISLNDVDLRTLSSKKEERVSFVGECLDMAGECGGYNLTWCLLSALIVSEALDAVLC